MVYKTTGVKLFRHCLFQHGIASLLKDDAWEKIIDEGQKEWFIAVYQLSQVDVAHCPYHECLLWFDRSRLLHGTQHTQQVHGAAQSEVILSLSKNIVQRYTGTRPTRRRPVYAEKCLALTNNLKCL